MIKKLISLLIICSIVPLVYGDNEGEKEKNGNGSEEVVVFDSISGDSIYVHINANEDTLVFEDWDGSTGLVTDNSAVEGRSQENAEGQQALDANDIIGGLIENHKKRYEVSFEIYPNPTADQLHINAERPPQEIRIISLSGQLILQTVGVDVIDVSSYDTGIYFIELIYFDHIETRKFVKRV